MRRGDSGYGDEKTGGDSARSAGGRGRLGSSRAALVGMVAIALLVVGLTGCALNGTVAGPTPAGTVNSGGTPGAHATLTLPTVAATASSSGVDGQQGVKEFCFQGAQCRDSPGQHYPGVLWRRPEFQPGQWQQRLLWLLHQRLDERCAGFLCAATAKARVDRPPDLHHRGGGSDYGLAMHVAGRATDHRNDCARYERRDHDQHLDCGARW